MTIRHREAQARPRFRIPTLREIFASPFANRFRRIAGWRRRGWLGAAMQEHRQRSLRFETLEPRVLLSADLTHTVAAGTSLDATLKVDDTTSSAIVRLVDNPSGTVLAETALDQDVNVTVQGADMSDRLHVAFDQAILAHQVRVSFDGGAGGEDEIVGPDHAATWTLSASGAGTIDANVSFSDVEKVSGGSSDNTFVVLDASTTTKVQGGGGKNTLVAADVNNAWTISGTDAGTLDSQTFSGIQNVQGGAGQDTITLAPGGQVSGSIDGGGGNDTIVGADQDNAWTISGANSGTLNGTAFANIENLAGGSGQDTFTFTAGGALSGGLSGGAGNDTIVAADGNNVWIISGQNAGTLNGQSFSGIENLTGGAGNDAFIFAGGSISGRIDGAGGVNTFDYSQEASAVTIDLQAATASGAGALSNIGNFVGGSGDDTLVGRNADSTWTVDGAGSGSVAGDTFSNIENLSGGSGADRFVFTGAGTLAGGIDGGEGSDTLVGADRSNQWNVTGSDAGTLDAMAYVGIESLLGGSESDVFTLMAAGLASGGIEGGLGADTVRGPQRKTLWRFSGAGKGSAGGVAFSGVEAVQGASDDDTFAFDDGADFAGSIDGGAGANSLDYSAYTSAVAVDLASGTATGVAGFSGIASVTGGAAADTLAGPAADATWTVSGANSGDVNGIAFSSFENLQGAADNQDSFVFEPGASLSGVVDGGPGGFDTLVIADGSYSTVVYTSTGPSSGTVDLDGNVITYTGLEPVLTPGGTATDVVFNLPTASANQVVLEDDATAGNGISQLRSTNGTFELTTFSNPSGSLTINFGNNGDTLTLKSLDSTFNAALNINGGTGADHVIFDAKTGSGVYTINGGAGSDTIEATANANLTLHNNQLSVGSTSLALASIEHANLTNSGSSGHTLDASAFTAGSVTLTGGSGDDILKGGGGDDTLVGGSGNDTYVFAGAWGSDTVVENANEGNDKLDFTALDLTSTTLTVSTDRTDISDGTNHVIQSATAADQAEGIDLTLPYSAASLQSSITGGVDTLLQLIHKAEASGSGFTELTNALPFLSQLTNGKVPDLADLLNLDQALQDLKAAVNNALGSLPATPKLSDIVAALNSLSKPAMFTTGSNHLTFSSDYRGALASPHALEALIDMDLHGTASDTVALETGAAAKTAGIDLQASVNASATLSGVLTLGMTTGGGLDVFLVPEKTLRLDVSASASLGGSSVNLGVLALTLNSGSLSYDSYVDLTLHDNGDSNGRIDTGDLSGSLSDLASVATGVTTPFSGSLSVGIDPGVKITGVDLSTKTISASVSLPDGVFGSSAGASSPQFDFSIPSLPGVSLDDFGNVSVSDLLGMLGQVLDSFNGLGQSAILKTAIPFTGKTLGDVVDLASGFKSQVLDPLFRTGDVLNPDFNGDGAVDFQDLYFSSIQGLAKAITAELGLGNLLDVNYDSTANELTFSLNYGKSVSDASAVETTPGNDSTNEVQTLTIDAPSSGGILTDKFRLALPTSLTDANAEVQYTSLISLGAPDTGAGSVQSALAGLTLVGSTSNVGVVKTHDAKGDHYAITFQGTLADKHVPLMIVDASQLALGIPLDFGTSLGDIASVKTQGEAIMAASLAAGMTFGINLGQSSQIEITPPLFQPDNQAAVTVQTTTDGTTNLDEVQLVQVDNATSGTYRLALNPGSTPLPGIGVGTTQNGGNSQNEQQTLTLANATGGTFTLSFGGATTGPIDYNAPATGTGSVEDALNNLSTINSGGGSVSVSGSNGGPYTITFDGGPLANSDVAQLSADAGKLFNSKFTPEIAFNAPATGAGSVQAALQSLPGITVGVTPSSSGNDRAYSVEFTSPAHTNVQTLVAVTSDANGQTTLFGPAGNGVLSANANIGDIKVFYSPAVAVATPTQGSGTQNEQQTITLLNASSGSFTLSFGGQTTGDLTYGATDSVVALALNGLSTINAAGGSVSVLKTDDNHYSIAFDGGPLAKKDVATLSADGSKLVNGAAAIHLTNVAVNADSTNTSLADLAADVQNAINQKLIDGGLSLGFFDASLTDGNTFTAAHTAGSSLATDLAFTLTVGTRTVNGSVRKWDADAHGVAAALGNAINGALGLAGLGGSGGITVTVGGGGVNPITLTPHGGDLDLAIRSPIAVDSGGGRIAISAPQVTVQMNQFGAPVNLDGTSQVTAAFSDPAYQEMGVMSEPTHYDGRMTNGIDATNHDLDLVVNGVLVPLTLAASNTSANTSLADLVSDLQGAIDTALTAKINPHTSTNFSAGDVTAFLVDPQGNRIGFRGKDGAVLSLAVNVGAGASNGAVTDLGFVAGNGTPHVSKAQGFFLDNVDLSGHFALAAQNVTATASLGFLGITATGGGTLDHNKFIDLNVGLSLKNPVDGTSRLTVGEIAAAIKNGDFLYDASKKGGTADDPGTGVVDATVSGGVGIHLDVEPSTPLGGISALQASLDLTTESPNWLTAAPSFADPLGFGTDSHDLSATPVTLDTAAPTNGQLSDSVTFVISDGTKNAVVFLSSKATSGFSSASDLQNALQTAVNNALTAASMTGTVTVGLDGGKITLAGDSGLSARGPIAFSGPDLQSIIDKFRDLSFDDIIGGLKFIINFLQSLEGTGGSGSPIAGALAYKIPLIDKSVSDLVDIAGQFTDKLNAIINNPSGSIQDLNKFIDGALGLPTSTNILSYDAASGVLGIEFDLAKSAELSRPFDLNLADAGLPAAFTNLVSLSASGSLNVSASIDFDLKMGLDLSGPDKAFFLVTGAQGTKLDASLSASGQNLSFSAALGPFALSVLGGSASLDGTIDVSLKGDNQNRLNLVSFDSGGPHFNTSLSTNDVQIDFPTDNGKNSASVNLPLFLGTADSPIPLDFAGANPGTHNALAVDVDLVKLLTNQTGAFSFTLPSFDFSNFQVPGLFALLSDPSMTVDGLDRLLGTVQDALNGEVMGVKLPLIGDALANNPVANFIGDLRSHVLQPLANTIRENDLNMDGLIGVIQTTLFGVFHTDLGILKDTNHDGSITKADVEFTFLDSAGAPTSELQAHAVQLDMDLGKTFTFAAPPVDLDLGIPALGIHAQLQPEVSISFDLHLGFGIDDQKGFYFVSDKSSGGTNPQLSLTVYADLGSQTTAANPAFDDPDRAHLDAQLLFLALKLADGVDLNGDGIISRGTDNNGDGIPDVGNEFTHVKFTGAIDIRDPNSDGKLTIPEMVSGSFSDIVKPTLTGEASLHAQAKVDFSTLGPDLGNVLPSVSTDLLIDFGLHADTASGFQIDPPQVVLANVTLDLGSFISSFAGPILDQIHKILSPVDWLIGPDGFLNKRIPLLSDLAGHTITGKDLIVAFDPEDGPTVVALLNFVQQLDYLSGLVSQAAGEGDVGLNFGDLVLAGDPGNVANPFHLGAGFLDHPLNIGLPSGSNLQSLNSFKNISLPSADQLKSAMTTQGSAGSATSSFTSGVSESASIDFAILKPENIFKLILGQPDVTLVDIQLPKMQFNFLYRQAFPIIGPLVGTFAGGIGGGIDFGFGYDTRGLSEFLTSKNPADLIDGFFLNDLDPKTGQDVPEAYLNAQIAVGAALDLGIASAGVEGGISATIDFNLADLDKDGKVRLNELAANIEANSFNPLAVFDISGEIDLFMRAYVEFLFFKAEFEFARLKLFEFDIPFDRPPLMGSMSGDTLTLNVGPNAAARLNGNTSDGAESITATMDGGDVVISSFSVDGNSESVPEIKGFGRFSGVHKIVVDGGAGDDVIDLSGIDSSITIDMHGGAGNDTLSGGAGDDTISGDAGNDIISGGGGADTISGGDGNDQIDGGAGNDTLSGDAGNDSLHAGAGTNTLMGGSGNDQLFGDAGTNTYDLADFGSIDTIDASSAGLDTLDFTGMAQTLTFFLLNPGGSAPVIEVGMKQTTPTAPGVEPVLSDFESQLTVTHAQGVSTIKGGDLADTFYVHGTSTAGVTIDGGKGSDRFVLEVGTDPIKAAIDDTGNPWDSANVIDVQGTGNADTITVKSSEIDLASNETVTYVAPAADANVLQIKVFGEGGDDTLNVESTAGSVPVRVDAGGGNDFVTVGGSGTVNNIAEQSRNGLNSPFGLGPVVLVGGGGQDTVLIDDGADTGANTGSLTAFTETRLGVTGTVEVGVVSGLGMTLDGNPDKGRVEFEGFETSDVRLGRGDDGFTIGGDAVKSALPQNRQLAIQDFVNTITGMTIVEGGGGNDTIGVVATNTLERSTLLTALLTQETETQGGVSQNEVQKITVSAAARNVGYFTLGYRFEETRPILFGASAREVQNALTALPLIGFNAANDPNVAVSKSTDGNGNDVYTVTFQHDLANLDVPDLVPAVTPLIITGDTSVINATVQTTTAGNHATSTDEVQQVTVHGVDTLTTFTLTFQSSGDEQTTAALAYGADAATVQAALEALSNVGSGNVSVTGTGTDIDPYVVKFQNALKQQDVAQLIARIAQDGADTLRVQSIREDTFFLGGGGDDQMHLNVDALSGNALSGNGINSQITLDGQGGSDAYDVHLVGGATASLVNVFDSGTANDGSDDLTVTGTELPDLFLLRAAAAQTGLAFIALLNQGSAVERVNYNVNLETITVNSLGGDDKFYIDDTRASITINAGDGNDFFQIGQLYQTERTTEQAGVAPGDVFATIETTKGWLSNGVSAPITINGDAGEDLFIVFHNLAVATLNGGADDDTFIVQAFALAGSTEDHRALTDLSGDAGADFIQYAVDAPVNINGGDGFDTVIVIGTEFSDDFVVTPHGVYGAGLNVNFTGIELLQVDGAEGNDRFFVLGTGPDFVTEISGGLGTDLFSINGPTPANGVISNDLLGHSGILSFGVNSNDTSYAGLQVVGISASIADNDEPAIIVNQTDGATSVVQGGLPSSGSVSQRYSDGLASRVLDSYSIVLSRPPINGSQVVISLAPPPGLVFVKDDGTKLFAKRKGTNANGDNATGAADGLTLTFTASDWYKPRTVYVAVDSQVADIPDSADVQHKVVATDGGGNTRPELNGTATGGGGNGSAVTIATATAGDSTLNVNEVQTVAIAHTAADFGYFALKYGDEETDPIAFGASASDVATALLALPLVGKDASGNPNVSVGGSGTNVDPYVITFQNGLGHQDVQQLTGRELSTLVDPALSGIGMEPGGSQALPEGLRGATVTITDSLNHPEIVGQSRLILFNNNTGTLVLNKAWDLHGLASLPTDARYEIKLFGGMAIPNVHVQIYSQQTPALVVAQTEGSTSVAEISTSTAPSDLLAELASRQVDEIDVRLSALPSGTVTVNLGGSGQLEFFDKDNLGAGAITSLTFSAGNYDQFRHLLVRGIDDHVVEGFHKADLTLAASGANYDHVSDLIVTDIADNDSPGVRIIESDGSTKAIEFTSGEFPGFGGVTQTQADAAGMPYGDKFQIVLTSAPTQDVTVTVNSDPTRTSRTGGIRSFAQQLLVSTDGVNFHKGDASDPLTVTFTAGDWSTPQTIYVRAVDNSRVDGTDTKVFAQQLPLLNSIQGPLFINGGSGPDRTGLLESEPVMLPGETDELPAMGNVAGATEAAGIVPATITINPGDISQAEIDQINAEPNASVHITGPLIDPSQLVNVSIEITHGPGKNKVRYFTGGTVDSNGDWVMTLNHSWLSPFPAPGNSDVPDATSKYVLLQTNPNLLVNEADQTDILQVYDTANVNSYNDPALNGGVNPYAVGRLFYDDQNKFGPKATISTEVNGGPKVDGPTVSEQQKLVLTATSGTFTLVFGGQVTSSLSFDATAAQIQAALEALTNIGTGNVTVSQVDGEAKFDITFQGALANLDVPQLQADSTNLVGGQTLDQFRITGLGMGGSGDSFQRTIGSGFSARSEPGGITLQDIEDLQIDLGPGNDHFTISDTPQGTKTTLNTGAGDDLVDVLGISGHTFVNLGAGSDTIDVHDNSDTLAHMLGLLTVSGDVPQVNIVNLAKGSPAQGGGLIAPVDEIQQVTVDATGGTFKLSFGGQTTDALAFDISAAGLKSALENLSSIGSGNVTVSQSGNVYRVSFVNGLGAQDVELLAADDSGLTNGLGSADTMNVVDSGNTSPSVGVLTSSSLTGLDTRQVNEIQSLVVDATQGTFTVSFNGYVSAALPFDVTASGLQAALEALAGIMAGDVAVTKNGDVYDIRFQGNLTNVDVPQLGAASIDLKKQVELPAGDPNAAPSASTATAGDPQLADGSVTVSTRIDGTADPKLNDQQVVTVNATGGSYTLTLLRGTAQEFTTDPIAFDASAEAVRQTIQNAAAAAIAPGNTFEPQLFDVTVERYENVYIVGFQGKLRQFNQGPGVDLLSVDASALAGSASVTTRMDGINYYGIEHLNLDTGSNDDIVNIQGTTAGSRGFYQGGTLNGQTYAPGMAITNIATHDGNDQVYVSSNADLDFHTAPGFDFLTGNLDDVNGALNLDLGTGRQRLLISDESSTVGDSASVGGDGTPVVITDTAPGDAAARGLASSAEIWITGLAGQPGTYPEGGISYKAPGGNFFDGVEYWTGSGNDTVAIDGTANRSGSGQRTMTLLDTGLGNDNVTVSLVGQLDVGGSDLGQDGYFALNTQGGDDKVDASASSLPLVMFGGVGEDDITGGTGNDIIFGDDGRVQYGSQAVVGFGGRGDVTSSQVLFPTWAMSRDLVLGGSDTIRGNAGEDILVGGAAGDAIDGNAGDDLVFGDAVKLSRRPADITNPRFEALSGTQIYDASSSVLTNGNDQVDGIARNYRDPNGTYAPSWALWRIHDLYHSADVQAGVAGSLGGNIDGFGVNMLTGGTDIANSFGDDYIAGGAGSDEIFGQLGNDTIQGDGSIDPALTNAKRVFAYRDANGVLQSNPSFDAPATDGNDYIEGGGGNDVVFGNQGQDDIVGGSSDLFTLNTRDLRPDGSDTIFGGSGTQIARNAIGDATIGSDGTITANPNGHANDSDMILGDNGDIFRLVGVNGALGGGGGVATSNSFLAFNYDSYGTLKIIARAARLLDYTPGGLDYSPAAASDIGAADEIHGESGDDFIYGQKGSDVIYGDGQDDDIVGGYGNDWISGGTGDDGVIGDDGRIFTSRNGTAEPLNGVNAATTQGAISTPGNFQTASTYVTGTLTKAVDLTPFSQDPNWNGNADEFAGATPPSHTSDDIIYGGLGNDWLHGGSGDDAISGAEALPEFFNAPVNLGNVLAYDPTTGEFAKYDEFNPMVKIAGFLLNFNENEGPTFTDPNWGTVHTDGEDKIFGDNGNDWLVGGTGRDDLYGGWGNDLINADDNQSTDGSLNDQPDTNSSYEDRAYGGAGRDVLIANTGGDRLIDWVGEFNSYLVPFAPFGLGTVSRTLQPQLQDFLYGLSASDGADYTRAADTGADPARNGEPMGELGVVIQQDFAWQDQTGGPRDVQAGNIPGGKRDVLRSASFDGAQATSTTAGGFTTVNGFSADSGKWAVQNGALQVSASSLHGDAVSVFDVGGDPLPSYFEMQASVLAVKPTSGWNANSFLIFDYQNKADFKFAGLDVSLNKLVMGHRDATGWHVDDQASVQAGLKANTYYNMLLAVNGVNATLVVNNNMVFTYTFQPRIIDGYSYGLNAGMVGVGSNNSQGAFDNVVVQVLPPQITFDQTVNFDDGTAPLFTGGTTGTWSVGGGVYSAAPGGMTDMSMLDIGTAPLAVSSYLELSANVTAGGRAGFVFDRYGDESFKFVVLDTAAQQVVIGHYTAKKGWENDATLAAVLGAGTTHALDVALKGTTVSVTLDGQVVLGYAFNAATVDGSFGLLATGASASFDNVRIKTDDPQFIATTPANEMAGAATAGTVSAGAITQSELDSIATVAISQWTQALGNGDARLAALGDVRFGIADLGSGELGQTAGNTVLIDRGAAGSGWFVDASPSQNSEFQIRLDPSLLAATPDSAAYGHMDLVSVVEHEIGHVLGFEHTDVDQFAVMHEDLDAGMRMLLDPATGPVPGAQGPATPQAVRATPAFDALPGMDAAPSASIDWLASPDSGWSVALSPYAPQATATGPGNFSSFNATGLSARPGDASSDASYDQMGRDLIGKKPGKAK